MALADRYEVSAPSKDDDPAREHIAAVQRDQTGDDAEFIAFARSAVPQLCDAVEALEQTMTLDLAAARQTAQAALHSSPDLARLVLELADEVERLRPVREMVSEMTPEDQAIVDRRPAMFGNPDGLHVAFDYGFGTNVHIILDKYHKLSMSLVGWDRLCALVHEYEES